MNQNDMDGIHTCHNECQRPACVAIREAVNAEREECARLCDAIASAAEINEMACDEDKIEFYSSRHLAADDCSDLIRARGQQ
jgi:hypothetical protein